jgi:hypothetical protein
MRDLFGIAFVHLAAVGFDKEFRHGASGILTQSALMRQPGEEDQPAGACAGRAVPI